MRFLTRIVVFFFLLSSVGVNAQRTEVHNPNNKAQAYAILSAEYSREAYLYAKQNFFANSGHSIKANSDTALVYLQIALEYADSALLVAYDSSEYAKSVMIDAKKHQEEAIGYFKRVGKENNQNDIHYLAEEAMYASGNGLRDAYEASLFFDWEEGDEEDKLSKERDVTRLESDELAFMTIKEIYGKRLIDIEDEILALEQEAKTATGEHLKKIKDAIAQLKEEEKDLLDKMKNAEDKLVNVKTDLSEEMLEMVNKDVFTTNKNGFYNEEVPVPVNSKMPEGLVYRVQIGFFKNQLPASHFEGVFPISSEKIDNEYYRYMAGNFKNYEDAKNAKLKLIDKGYSGFVVAYINGQKISIKDALNEEKKEK